MKLEAAQQLVAHVADYMRLYCEVIEVAGSVRRRTPDVGDLEIVLIPKREEQAVQRGLFLEPENVNTLFEAMRFSEFIRWIKPGTSVIEEWPLKQEGKYWRGLIERGKFDAPSGIKLDVFIARPENFGVIYTIRTGSADFSRALVTYARDKTDYRVAEGELKYKGGPVPCPDEETLFSSLNLEWIEPRLRRGDRDIRVLQ